MQVHREKNQCRGRQSSVKVRAGVTDVLGVLAFSALPFATVQAFADSDFGKKLRVRHVQKISLYPVSIAAGTWSRT